MDIAGNNTPEAPARQNNVVCELTDLEQRVYAAVAYRAIFEFPPTAHEIHRYLPGLQCSLNAVEASLADGNLIPRYLSTDGRYYTLRGRESYFAVRQARERNLEPLLARAQKFGRLLANTPFVEMVAITGSLAARNPDSDADIDLFVVLKGGHLWRTRLLIRIMRHIDRTLGTRSFCPNSMRTTRSLKLEFQRLYVAQELHQMQPIFGQDVYHNVMDANGWARQIFPNAKQPPEPLVLCSSCQPYLKPIRTLLELILGHAFGDAVERWWSRRKIAQFEQPGHPLSTYTPFTREQEGLNLAVADTIEAAFQRELKNVGIALTL